MNPIPLDSSMDDVTAATLGEIVARKTMEVPHGDYIDLGLILVRLLKEHGFHVIAAAVEQAAPGGTTPGPCRVCGYSRINDHEVCGRCGCERGLDDDAGSKQALRWERRAWWDSLKQARVAIREAWLVLDCLARACEAGAYVGRTSPATTQAREWLSQNALPAVRAARGQEET
jgi:hypothetical protein